MTQSLFIRCLNEKSDFIHDVIECLYILKTLESRPLLLALQCFNVFVEKIHNVGFQILASNLVSSFAGVPLLSVGSKEKPLDPDADVAVVGVD